MSRRILVTGSRDWVDREAIASAVMEAAWTREPEVVTLVHGACPTGADAIADELWALTGWPVERHPADWSMGRSAGPKRNAHMVSLGADICLAFIGGCTSPRCVKPGKHPSHGAAGCADLAERAGITTRRYFA